ncbi:tail fiber assembly protein [Xenorhabdus bovienii]|uniref:tail fiber assembly protein n=1 Tax=Xenorhabdus bovienii TaxID=40576 RepID=UPI0023B2C2EA|nr:tail fiber assembly protein [Xenorhabdus bovienii]MDE9462715.1 tail fiber assembly protein [Xenorhabdus bovienii]MDE9470520.1 tail fiber assembly protein [Xenorhabdus bovienii]
MKYKYSDNEFYPYSLKQDYVSSGIWSDGGVDVDEAVFKEYTTPPLGKIRIIGNNGLPAWDDAPPSPPLTPEELQQLAKSHRKNLLDEADTEIIRLERIIRREIATPDEQKLFDEWELYSIKLYKLDTSTAPNIIWPKKPE